MRPQALHPAVFHIFSPPRMPAPQSRGPAPSKWLAMAGDEFSAWRSGSSQLREGSRSPKDTQRLRADEVQVWAGLTSHRFSLSHLPPGPRTSPQSPPLPRKQNPRALQFQDPIRLAPVPAWLPMAPPLLSFHLHASSNGKLTTWVVQTGRNHLLGWVSPSSGLQLRWQEAQLHWTLLGPPGLLVHGYCAWERQSLAADPEASPRPAGEWQPRLAASP